MTSMRNISLIFLLLLGACDVNNIDIQKDYTDHRDKCQELAEAKLPYFVQGVEKMGEADKKSHLFSLFKNCMQNKGWAMGKDVAAPAPTAADVIGEAGWRKFDYGVGAGSAGEAAPQQPQNTSQKSNPPKPLMDPAGLPAIGAPQKRPAVTPRDIHY
jgi:hypothetical protein